MRSEVKWTVAANMATLNITKEQVNILYNEAGSEMNYCDQVFTYDKEISVTQQYKDRINSVLTAMEVNFKPAEFQVDFRTNAKWLMTNADGIWSMTYDWSENRLQKTYE